ncbi:hypothetical protein CapIbe_013661 [Capra ibex]
MLYTTIRARHRTRGLKDTSWSSHGYLAASGKCGRKTQVEDEVALSWHQKERPALPWWVPYGPAPLPPQEWGSKCIVAEQGVTLEILEKPCHLNSCFCSRLTVGIESHQEKQGVNAQKRGVNDHLPCSILGGVTSGAKYQEMSEGMISRVRK